MNENMQISVRFMFALFLNNIWILELSVDERKERDNKTMLFENIDHKQTIVVENEDEIEWVKCDVWKLHFCFCFYFLLNDYIEIHFLTASIFVTSIRFFSLYTFKQMVTAEENFYQDIHYFNFFFFILLFSSFTVYFCFVDAVTIIVNKQRKQAKKKYKNWSQIRMNIKLSDTFCLLLFLLLYLQQTINRNKRNNAFAFLLFSIFCFWFG